MKFNIKDNIKLSIALGVLMIIFITVIIVMIQYQVEGEKNISYKLSKLMIISTAEGVPNAENTDEKNKWNLSVSQNNDVYLFIDKDESKENSLIESVAIENINVTKQPNKGVIKSYMPSSLEGKQVFSSSEEYIIDEKLEYKGGKASNPKILEIGNQGGFACIRFSNTGIGNFVSDENTEIRHDGSLIKKINVEENDIKYQVAFDLIMKIDNIKYKANISLGLPLADLCENGTATQEITDMSDIVFKRVK